MQRAGCQLPTGNVFSPARTGNVFKGTDLQFCRPKLALSLLFLTPEDAPSSASPPTEGIRLLRPVAVSAMPSCVSGRQVQSTSGICVRLVLNSKLYPEIRQNQYKPHNIATT